MKILFIFLYGTLTRAYNLCVIGSTSGLGKELVYQSTVERNMSVLALSGTSKPLTIPCRENSFEEINSQPIFNNPNIKKDNYWKSLKNYEYENIVFTTSAKPFKEDYSDRLLVKILADLPKSCKHLILISAYGVGDSLNENELGINVMNKWYLKDVYRSKNNQENILDLDIFKTKYPELKTTILRPKALSYGKTILPSIPREQLAKDILDKIDLQT
tara:strand:- start:343 stop:990 length:648 start_codon:yes stop_codon:yes gene_type:complete